MMAGGAAVPGAIGFILQSTVRMLRERAVVHVHGVLDDGRSFVVRDGRDRPGFWIRTLDANRAAGAGAELVDAGDGPHPRTSTMAGEPVTRVVVRAPAEVPPLRDRLQANGIPCFEADVPFASRYLIDRGIRAAVEIEGNGRPGRGVDVMFDDPELRPAEFSPELTVLSIDIETDPTARKLLSVALVGCGADEVLLLSPEGGPRAAAAIPYPDEASLLSAFARRVREIDPDVLTGWNVVDFDFRVLDRMAVHHRMAFDLGRGAGGLRIFDGRGSFGSGRAIVPGRVVLDGLALVRGAFLRFDSYALNAVAREVVGRGKTITGSDRADEILRMYRDDPERFVEYNRNDARLVLEILDRLQLVPLAVERSRLTGMPPDRVAASIASFDFLYLTELARRGVVAPTVHAGEGDDVPQGGGHVLEPAPGLYENVLVVDFKSLYPSLIRTFQIDPLGHDRPEHVGDDPIVAPNGAHFGRKPGILPQILDELFPRREEAKRRGDPVASQAIKILMNSFYGVLGTSACRFHSPEIANAITSFGREILLWTKARIERDGLEVLYGDTDSLFVRTGADTPDDARRLAERLVAQVNDDLTDHVRAKWRVESRLELEFDRLFLKLLLPSLRHGAGGARKRYAGLVETADGGTEVTFTGLEVVRRDWTALAKEVQRELYTRLFRDLPVDRYLREIVAALRAGSLDDRLVYRKTLRKPLHEYRESSPPHVVAARRMTTRVGRVVRYVVTGDGPYAASEPHPPPDHEHYVQRQIRPVAEPVLAVLGIDFDRAIGDDTQMRLF